MDLLEYYGTNVKSFGRAMMHQLRKDLGKDADGESLLRNLWPTSAALSQASLSPVVRWICRSMPPGPARYPILASTDMPARVRASEISRASLMKRLRGNVPYAIAVTNEVWIE